MLAVGLLKIGRCLGVCIDIGRIRFLVKLTSLPPCDQTIFALLDIAFIEGERIVATIFANFNLPGSLGFGRRKTCVLVRTGTRNEPKRKDEEVKETLHP